MDKFFVVAKLHTFLGATYTSRSDVALIESDAIKARDEFFAFFTKAKTEKMTGALGDDKFRVDISRVECIEIDLEEEINDAIGT